jgi:cation-transporting ATPase E
MIFNIALNTFQEFFARKRIEQFELATRLKATVIREGKTRSIDPGEIVPGDIVLVGPGDQLPVDGVIFGDGEILVDDSMLNIEGNQGMKSEGDNIYAGSICLTGQAALQTTKVGSDRRIVGVLNEAELTKQELTPIQRIIDRVLRVMLVIVALLLLMVLSTNYRLDLGIPPEILIDVSSVIFSIAPAGLFFMILLTYAAGTADLAKIGALVRQARSVESLARVNALCFAKGGVLTGTDVEIVPILSSNEINNGESIPESRIRQILGDFARSTSIPSPLTRALFKSF